MRLSRPERPEAVVPGMRGMVFLCLCHGVFKAVWKKAGVKVDAFPAVPRRGKTAEARSVCGAAAGMKAAGFRAVFQKQGKRGFFPCGMSSATCLCRKTRRTEGAGCPPQGAEDGACGPARRLGDDGR